MDSIGIAELPGLFNRLRETMSREREKLIAMDSVVGDGDLGITMDKAFTAAAIEVETQIAAGEEDLAKILMKAGMKMASAAPSTMGTLIGSGFMSGGKALQGCSAVGTQELAAFFTEFLNIVLKRGKAQPGEKTVIDVLKPVADRLTELGNMDLFQAVREISKTSKDALESTREMVAQHGKAATFSDKSQGLVDQGAYVIDLIVDCLCETVIAVE